MHNQVCFDRFCFEPTTGLLTRNGHRLKLQPKVAALLTYLLEHPGEVVSRAELQRRLWPEGIHVDYEAGLKVAVKKLRDVLGDHAGEPLYVQTVPGEGYRFIAAVSSECEEEAEVPAETRGRSLWAGAIAAGILALASILIFKFAGTRHFQKRDWILIAVFENRTGNPLLDGTLEYALERELSESRYVNVVPQDRINDALQLMRLAPGTPLDSRVARDVAVRDGGIHAVLVGRIEKWGAKYVVGVRLLDPATDETIAAFSAEGDADHLPGAARSISDRVRGNLGERASLHRQDETGLERATTPSLAALRAFTAGMKAVNARNWDAAAALFEQATRADADFASAHIYAAHCYSNLNRDDQAAPHYQAAFRLAPFVSDRERLFILGSYYERFRHDDRQALPLYQSLVALYPDDYWGVNNLAAIYGRLGNFYERIRQWERMRELRPNEFLPILVQNLWQFYSFQQPDRAKADRYADQLRGWLKTGVISPLALLDAATDRWRNGDITGALREVSNLTDSYVSQHRSEYIANMAMVHLAFGRVRAAEQLCLNGDLADAVPALVIRPILPSAGINVKRTECLLLVAYARDDRKLGREYLASLENNGPSTIALDGMLAGLWLRDLPIAERWEKAGGTPAAHLAAWLHQARGDPRELIHTLSNAAPDPARATLMTLWIRYWLATLLEQQGQYEEAADQLDPVTRPAMNYLFYAWTWPPYRAKVAELYRKASRPEAAAKVENELRLYLSEADRDYPIVQRLSAPVGPHLASQ